MKKPSFKSNVINLKYYVFAQGHPSDATKYEDSMETLANYFQREYSMGIYLVQEIREGKFPDLDLPIKLTKDRNQSDDEFDMEVFKWKDNMKNVFGRVSNIEEVNKKLYSLFTDQCDPSLKTKLKGNKGYDNSHNTQDAIKILELIRSAVCGME